jgi:hypothetical protein
MSNTIPEARDMAYPGTMLLDVDATDTQRGIFRRQADDPGGEERPYGFALSRNGCRASTARAARSRS